MRWNESEMVQLAWDPNWSWEGKLTYKSSKNSMKSKHLSGIFQGGTSSDEPRERLTCPQLCKTLEFLV